MNKGEAQYKQLEKELKPYLPLLQKAADAILDQDISSYPIFLLHQQTVSIGIPLVEGKNEEHPWSVNASTLEELATKKIIEMERVDDFRKVYKDPQDYFCLLLLSDSGADFVFFPRP